MANSVMSKPSLQPRKGRNGFDLSFHRNYTSPLGALLPIFSDFAIVGDKYRLNTQTFVRTEPLEKAAFARFKHHVDWFFVPMTQLYSLWNEFYNQTNDVMSSIFPSVQNISTGNIWPQCTVFPTYGKFFLNNIAGFSEFDTSLKVTSYYADEFGVPKVWNFRRMWDMFGYGSLTRRGGVDTFTEKYLLIDFLAYHKCYHSHYRPTQWFANDPSVYNVDRYYSQVSGVDQSVVTKILTTVHYRPYRKDYFTNIMPSPVFNSSYPDYLFDFGLFSQDINAQDFRNILNPEFSSAPGSETGIRQDFSSNYGNYGASVGVLSNSKISSADIRTLFAFDKLLRVTAFAGSHYQDQVLAHYGIKIPEGISQEAYFLGSQSVPIVVNEVVANASTGAMEDGTPLAGSTLGDIAGKGFTPIDSKPGKDISFTCPCDGVIIGIQSIEILPDYSSMFCERQKRYLTTWDFYHPELDGIGMQPLTTDMFGYDASNSNKVRGWQYRYMEYKTRVDVTNEGLFDTNRYNWAPTKQSAVWRSGDQFNPGYQTKEFNFFIYPQTANNIFLKKYPFYGSPSNSLGAAVLKDDNTALDKVPYRVGATSSQSCYENDPFLISMDIKAFKTSVMSTFSLDKVL